MFIECQLDGADFNFLLVFYAPFRPRHKRNFPSRSRITSQILLRNRHVVSLCGDGLTSDADQMKLLQILSVRYKSYQLYRDASVFFLFSTLRNSIHILLLVSIDMLWFQIFQDGPEYEARKKRGTFSPPNLSLKQLREAVPRRLHKRSTAKSLAYLLRHLVITYVFFYLATFINPITSNGTKFYPQLAFFFRQIVRPLLWLVYWGWQGVTFAGIWCLGVFIQ